MRLWLVVFGAAFLAEFLGGLFAAYYQTSIRKMRRRQAVKWSGLLATLTLVDYGVIAEGLPFSALALGIVLGAMAGTHVAVTRLTIKYRLKKKRAGVASRSPTPSPVAPDGAAHSVPLPSSAAVRPERGDPPPASAA